jgi:hypothetical protein
MKNYFIITAVFCACLVFLSPLNVYSADEQITRGEFLKHLAESMGVTLKLPQNPHIDDYVNLLKNEGIKIPADFDTTQMISKTEKANFLSQALAIERKAQPKEIAQTFRDRAVIIKITGSALVKRQSETEWIPASLNMQLVEGDYIKTERESSVLLKVGVAGRIEIKENSELLFQALSTQKDKKAENVLLYLAMGEIFVDVKGLDPDSKFETHTPTTVAAVRGTTYIVRVEPAEGKTEIREEVK